MITRFGLLAARFGKFVGNSAPAFASQRSAYLAGDAIFNRTVSARKS
jgi:hypothetical protein